MVAQSEIQRLHELFMNISSFWLLASCYWLLATGKTLIEHLYRCSKHFLPEASYQ